MKYLKIVSMFFIICFVAFFSSACTVTEKNTISTTLKIDENSGGFREIAYTISEDILKDEQAKMEIDNIITKNCPSELSYVKSQQGTDVTYIFYLNFTSFNEYKNKVQKILSFDPGTVYSKQDNIFAKGSRYCENFNSADLLRWIEDACKASNNGTVQQLYLSCTKTSIYIDGYTKTTDEYININSVKAMPIDKIEIETINNGNNSFDRSFVFKIPRSTVERLKQENIISYFNARAINCSEFICNEYNSGNEYVIKFKNLDIAALCENTNSLFNSYLSSSEDYSQSNDYISMFCKEKSFNETLDLSSYCGKNNSEVDLSYSYVLAEDNTNNIYAAEKYSKGKWNASTVLNEKSASFEERVNSFKVNISDGYAYDVKKTEVQLDILAEDYFTRYIDFYLDNEEAFDNLREYLKNRNSTFCVEKVNGYEDTICRLSLSGSSEELTLAQMNIFGEGNFLNLKKKQDEIYSIHKTRSVIDSIDLSKVVTSNTSKEFLYNTNIRDNTYLSSVSHSEDAINWTNVNISQTDSKNISFNVESLNSKIVLSSYSANPIAVFFVFLMIILIIAIVCYILFKVKRDQNVLPEIKNVLRKNDGIFKDATDEEIIAILSKM